MSFEVTGGSKGLLDVGNACFVTYGNDAASIREAALYYASQKYGSSRLNRERIENQSAIGRWVNLQVIQGRGYYCLEPEQRAIVDAGGTAEYEGNEIKLGVYPVEIVGIYPTFTWNEQPCRETIYLSSKGGYLAFSELELMPEAEWDSFNFDLDCAN